MGLSDSIELCIALHTKACMRLYCSFTAKRHDGQHGCTVITTASKVKAVMSLIAGHCLIVLAIILVQIPKCP
jgi:hypothetical protein